MPDSPHSLLAGKLAKQVENRVRARGEAYYRSGAVQDVHGDGSSIEATVLGRSPYRTALRHDPDADALLASCTCPYFEDRGQICKHIWALVLHVDQEGLFSGWLGHEGEDAVFRQPPASPEATHDQQSQQTPRQGPAGRRGWRRALDRFQATGQQRPLDLALGSDQREIYYLLQVSTATRGFDVQVCLRTRKVDGNWGKLKPWSLWEHDAAQLADPADREILVLLFGAAPVTGYGYRRRNSTFPLPPAVESLLVERMCRTGRCILHHAPGDGEIEALRWVAGAPWQLRLAAEADPAGGALRLRGRLARDGEQRPLEGANLRFGSAVVLFGHEVVKVECSDPAWLELFGRIGSLEIPEADRTSFLEEFFRLPGAPPLDLPEALEPERIQGDPLPRLHVASPFHPVSGPRRLAAALFFDYEGRILRPEEVQAEFYDSDANRLLVRNLRAERDAVSRLQDLGVRRLMHPWEPSTPFSIPARKLPNIVDVLVGEGWQVEADGHRYRSAGDFQLQVTSGIDWFELEGTLQFEEESASLPELLKAAAAGERTVRLGDGSVGILPEQWLAQYGMLASLSGASGRRTRFQLAQVALMDALLADLPEVRYDDRFQAARRRLAGAEGIAPCAAPATFQGMLRDYQEDGLGWLRFLHDAELGGCLADDMGLGKTIQVLALLEWKRRRGKRDGPRLPSLAVVPRSVLWNWEQEAQRFTPKLKVRVHAGAGREVDFAGDDLVLTTYGTLHRDILEFQEVRFDVVVLDEAQAIKNASSARAKAVRLLKARRRLAMTGTPVENHLGELWSLFQFLNPGMLGSSAGFRRLLGGGGGNQAADERAVSLVAKTVRPFLLRRTKSQVATELPPRTEQTLHCELKGAQRRRYDELRRHYQRSLREKVASAGLERSKIQILEALLRLRQAACHPGLIDESFREEPGAKLEALLPQLREIIAEGHKALVFSQFTRFLAILRRCLDEEGIRYAYLDGRTRKRAEKVRQFETDPHCPLFLISLKAGGLGLNLTSASYVYLLDPWWNPAVEAQAIDRTHRIGQTRQVFAYRVIARDTVEERILELQDRKRDLAASIITADNSLLRKLRPEDLELLLS